MAKRLFVTQLILIALMFVALGWPMLLGLVYTQDDLGSYHLPTRFFYARSLAMGDSFTWIPDFWCGYYLHGEGEVGMYHPLHLILYSILPLDLAFNLEFLLGYPFMLVGTFLFLRRWELQRDAALFGAFVFTFSGWNLLQHVHPNIISVVAHTPWLLLSIEVVMCDRNPRRVTYAKLSVAVLTVSQILLGHPHLTFLSSVLEILYLLLRIPSWTSKRRLFALGEAKLLGILSSSIQLIPTLDMLYDSARAGVTSEYAYTMSLHPVNLLQFVTPYFLNGRVFYWGWGITHEFGLYNGAIASLMALWLLIRNKALGSQRSLALGAIALGILALIFALGKYGYLYTIQASLPVVGWLRIPARYIFLLHFALGVTSAIAFADLSKLAQRREPVSWRKSWLLAIFPVASVWAAGFALWLHTQDQSVIPLVARMARFVAAPSHIIAGPILVTVATVLVMAAGRGMRAALIGILLFNIVDQGVYGVSYIWRTWPTEINTFVEAQPLPPERSHHRIHSRNVTLIMKGIRLADGYSALLPKRMLDGFSGGRLQAAGVEWIQIEEGISPELDELVDLGVEWFPAKNPMARARMVSKVLQTPEPKNDIDTIQIESTALVSEAIHLKPGPAGTAVIVEDRPGMIKVETTTSTRQLLVLSESYHTGWRAEIDGEPCPVLRVYGDFMGCVVNAGRHSVEFCFQPVSLRLGGWISVLGLGLMLLSFLISRFRIIGGRLPRHAG